MGLVVEVGAVVACVSRAVVVRQERWIWALVGLSVCVWTLGDLYFRIALWNLDVVPIPSFADLSYLAFYPPAYAAVVLLVRSRVQRAKPTLWVDGVIGGLAVASIAAALVFDAVLGSAGGKPAVVAVGLAYPIGDMVLMALVIGGLNMSGAGWTAPGCGSAPDSASSRSPTASTLPDRD